MKLSILIPTIQERKQQLDRLIDKLLLSAMEYQPLIDFEILTESDNKEMSVGEKRNILISRARGEYTVFIDDDDDVNTLYVKIIMDTIKSNPNIDCIGFRGRRFRNGEFEREFKHALVLSAYYDDGNTYYRSVNHLNPIKATISKEYKFKHINSGEDQEWATRILCDCKIHTSVFIEEVMYYYMFDTNKTATNKF